MSGDRVYEVKLTLPYDHWLSLASMLGTVVSSWLYVVTGWSGQRNLTQRKVLFPVLCPSGTGKNVPAATPSPGPPTAYSPVARPAALMPSALLSHSVACSGLHIPLEAPPVSITTGVMLFATDFAETLQTDMSFSPKVLSATRDCSAFKTRTRSFRKAISRSTRGYCFPSGKVVILLAVILIPRSDRSNSL